METLRLESAEESKGFKRLLKQIMRSFAGTQMNAMERHATTFQARDSPTFPIIAVTPQIYFDRSLNREGKT